LTFYGNTLYYGETSLRFEFKSRKLDQLYFEKKEDHNYPPEVLDSFFEVMTHIAAAADERDLYAFKGLRFEKLKGKRKEQHSMRLNDQFRLILTIEQDAQGKYLFIINIEDYH
jgi:proteic killer suppression protein